MQGFWGSPGERFEEGLGELLDVSVGVDVGPLDRGVAEQLLHRRQVPGFVEQPLPGVWRALCTG